MTGAKSTDATQASPFHAGELAVQARVGVQEKVDRYGRMGIRAFMPEQHREFFAQLPMFVIGSSDRKQRPWASVLVGEPGFIESPSPTQLHVAATPAHGDPLGEALADGAALGGLGIELHTRRRNRVNGRIRLDADRMGFSLDVDQSFGNCPQYIQARRPRLVRRPAAPLDPNAARHLDALDAVARGIVARADTFFIASQAGGDRSDGRHGLDVSHRGVLPGSLAAVDERTLLWPDLRGNFFFNTLGNLALDARCGLLVPDFETGDTLQMTGKAVVVWDWPKEDPAFAGAQRLVRFELEEAIHTSGALPFAWDFEGRAPQFDVP